MASSAAAIFLSPSPSQATASSIRPFTSALPLSPVFPSSSATPTTTTLVSLACFCQDKALSFHAEGSAAGEDPAVKNRTPNRTIATYEILKFSILIFITPFFRFLSLHRGRPFHHFP